MSENRWIIGITGASGTVYARRLVRAMIDHLPDVRLDVIISAGAMRVMQDEEDLPAGPGAVVRRWLAGRETDAVTLHGDDDRAVLTLHSDRNLGASIASGSYPTRGMVIVPCSMKTLAAVAHGYGSTLIARAADVVLKERRRLVVVPRETPLSEIHLRNMLRLVRMGVAVVPAMPGFYHRPAGIDDLVDMMAMRILDQMGLEIDLARRWGRQESPDDRGGTRREPARA